MRLNLVYLGLVYFSLFEFRLACVFQTAVSVGISVSITHRLMLIRRIDQNMHGVFQYEKVYYNGT